MRRGLLSKIVFAVLGFMVIQLLVADVSLASASETDANSNSVVVVAGDEDGIDVVVVVVDDGVVVVVVPLCVGEAAGAAVVVVDTVTVADEVDEPASFPCASCTAEFEVAELEVGAEYVTDTTLPTAAAGDTLSRIVEPLTVTELTVRETPPTVTAYSPTVADVACKASL